MSSAFINSLGSSFGSLTTTQTKSQSRTKKKTTQSGKIVVKKNMTAQGYLIRMANAKSPAQVAGIIRAARADANAMKNSDAGKTAIAEAQKIADAIENKGTLKISRLKKEQQLRQKKQIEESVSIPVDTIAPQYYGMMNGKGVFKEIEKKYNL